MISSEKLFEEYNNLKIENPHCLLLMQVGAFMQVMNDDARKVSEITGIKLKLAGDPEIPVIIGGFSKSGLDKYIGKLVRKGHSIAIAMQSEDITRKVTERITIESKQ